jgi:hypothetical protein
MNWIARLASWVCRLSQFLHLQPLVALFRDPKLPLAVRLDPCLNAQKVAVLHLSDLATDKRLLGRELT